MLFSYSEIYFDSFNTAFYMCLLNYVLIFPIKLMS
mgnify:CR=1 FL=1